jgi:hypothetical protein
MKRIGIIGGGLGGCLTALELARQGYPVEIFEKNAELLREASFFNEGKVHLGYLYANDETRATSKLMAEGATYFRQTILKLTGFDVSEALSTPFLYALHRDSLVTSEKFEAHLTACSQEFQDAIRRNTENCGYVNGKSKMGFEVLEKSSWSIDLNQDEFAKVYLTDELGVDPRRLAQEVSRAVRGEPNITVHYQSKVEEIQEVKTGKWNLLDGVGNLLGHREFDLLINASWSDLLRLDSQLGLPLPKEWSYRYKLGNRIHRSISADQLNSVTVVLGAFGDLVNYGSEGGLFMSWYPSGRLVMTDEIELPDLNQPEYADRRQKAFEESRQVWEKLSNHFRTMQIKPNEVDNRGGVILASGRIDVDDPRSPLHSRINVGITSRGTYYSLNTGKYTLAPMLALQMADLVIRENLKH